MSSAQRNRILSVEKTQRGMTLISLMVSIVIMLVGVLVSLRLYNSHEQSIDYVRNATTHNRQLMTALIIAQRELPAAGFGIADASGADVVTQYIAGDSTTPASRSILWRYVENGAIECRGLTDYGVTIDEQAYRKLDLINSATDCSSTDSLTNLAWTGVSANLGQWEIEGILEQYIDDNETLFNFQLEQVDCAISRLTTAAEHLVARISAPNTAELNGHVLPSNIVRLCLSNIRPS